MLVGWDGLAGVASAWKAVGEAAAGWDSDGRQLELDD